MSLRPVPRIAALLLLALCAAAGAADHLRYLPKDSRLVMTINVAALPKDDAASFRKLGEKLYAAHIIPGLGADAPLAVRDVTSITIAMPSADFPSGTLIVRGKVNAKLLEKQAKASGGKVAPVQKTKDKGGSATIFRRLQPEGGPALPLPGELGTLTGQFLGGSDVHFTAPDDETLLMTFEPLTPLSLVLMPRGQGELLKLLKSRPANSKPTAAPDVVKLVRSADQNAWFTSVIVEGAAGPGLSLLMPGLAAVLQDAEHLVTTMRDDDKLAELTLVATAKDVAAAKVMEENAKENLRKVMVAMQTLADGVDQKGALKELAESGRVSRKDAVVTLKYTLSSSKSRTLFVVPPPAKKKD